jgi:glucoamylase
MARWRDDRTETDHVAADSSHSNRAPDGSGIPPTWTSSAKDAVGTALGGGRVWFTIGHGIVNEVYWPGVDRPQVRDLGFIVADDAGAWYEVKRLAQRTVRSVGPGVPAVISEFRHARFSLTLRICSAAVRDVLLIEAMLGSTDGTPMRLYPILAPHLGRTGNDNSAWIEEGPLGPAIVAERKPYALALVSDPSPERASVGFVGVSDGWQDFATNAGMTWTRDRADEGNVAGMIELPAGASSAQLALGFGARPAQALAAATAALFEPFEAHWERFAVGWRKAQDHLRPPTLPADLESLYRTSVAVIRSHEDRATPGAIVASLSIPWGDTSDDPGGYHLVWSRDLVEAGGALLAVGDVESAARVFAYLASTQATDGSWPQNQWIDGSAYWAGSQLDETAFPVILASALRDAGALDATADRPSLLDPRLVAGVVRRAVTFLVRTGPATGEDRWEEDAGLAPSTLAPVIAALVTGATFFPGPAAAGILEVADDWNASIERWTYATDTPLTRRLGLAGTYLRVSSAAVLGGADLDTPVDLRNRPLGNERVPATEMIGPDVLALVRFGLRAPDDPRIIDTLTAIDATLRIDTSAGPVWHRYTGDGYGETETGEPYQGTGIGRGWPMLTGERGHYAVAAAEDPLPYLRAMAAMSSGVGLIPEQVWDSTAIPERGLEPGRPTGSAMPLVWAHAEFLKLCHSRAAGAVVDLPDAVWQRWHGVPPVTRRRAWRLAAPIEAIPTGHTLRIELLRPGLVHYSVDDWLTTHDLDGRDTGIGLWVIDIPEDHPAGTAIVFTIRWTDDSTWERQDFRVSVAPEAAAPHS